MPSFVDVSGRAIVALSGPDSLDLLQRISTNDVLSLQAGRSIQTVLTNEKGRIVDVVSVANTGDGRLLLLGQSTKAKGLFSWVEKFIIMEEIRIEELTSNLKCKLLFGFKGLSEGVQADVLPGTGTIIGQTWGGERVVYTLAENANEAACVIQLGRIGFVEASYEEYEKYRITNGIPSYPNELSESYNPLEANLSSLIAWTKGCYVGQEVIARLDTYKKVQKKLSKMMLGELPDALPQTIFDDEGEAGIITSAIGTDSTGECHALGYVKTTNVESRRDFYYQKVDRRVSVLLKPNLH